MTDDSKLQFADEAPGAGDAPKAAGESMQILVVDDDAEVHAVTRLMLDRFEYKGIPVKLLHASSAAEARKVLQENPRVALILLDVVMETDQSGLELVRHVRRELKNNAVRIALRTGQPGVVPEHQIASVYAIDDYVLKSELTFLRVQTLVTTALRTYELVRELERTQAELRRANAELERMAATDPLTGLWNRRRMEEELQREWRRLGRERQPATVLMIDVDYFKPYNDSRGHPAGDEVLKQVAAVLSTSFRRGADTACRFGGEEFFVLLPGIDAKEGLTVAESARSRIEGLGIAHPESPLGVVTVSIGCATAREVPATDETAYRQLVESADQALYVAKQQGRNRVAAAPEPD